MENFRSKSCKDVRNMQIESYNEKNKSVPPNGMHGLRSYSTSYAYSEPCNNFEVNANSNEVKMKKSKKLEKNGSKSMKSWSFIDPELQRKKRVAGYKVYAVEGQLKGSFRKSFKWIKDRYSQVVYGYT